jgi:AcrR family transcriptional regulator
MHDRMQLIIDAGLGVLREHGYVGFTQPRVAARAGLRQSHLTYYFPTRIDLIEAVGRAAVDRQLAAVEATFAVPLTPEELGRTLADLVTRHENTRVLLALAQAGDQEPSLRHLFRELADGIVARVAAYFGRLRGMPPDEERARFLHRLAVGLAVVDLATGQPNGKQLAAEVLQTALRLMTVAPEPSPRTRPDDGSAPNDGENS